MSAHADQVEARLADLASAEDQADDLYENGEAAEAIRLLTDAQNDLRDLKREIIDAERRVRLDGQAARQQATASAQQAALFGKSARRVAGRVSAVARNQVSQEQTRRLAEYAPLRAEVDQMVADFSRQKDEIRTGRRDVPSASHPASRPTEPTNEQLASQVAPRWAPDPEGSGLLRWWDGSGWTSQFQDPAPTSATLHPGRRTGLRPWQMIVASVVAMIVGMSLGVSSNGNSAQNGFGGALFLIAVLTLLAGIIWSIVAAVKRAGGR
jgi:hypothetical protein